MKVSAWWLVASAAIGGAAGALFAVLALFGRDPTVGPWLRSFALSPGAAGLAAVVAAIFALIGISVQIAHQRAAAAEQSWWSTFQWTADRGVPQKANDNPLPKSVTIGTLEHLARAASTDVQRGACSGMLAILIQERGADEDGQEAALDSKLDALESYAQSLRGTTALAGPVEAAIYEERVLASLRQAQTLRAKLLRNPPGGVVDAIATLGDEDILVEVLNSRSGPDARNSIKRKLQLLADRGGGQQRLLIVTPVEPSAIRGSVEDDSVVVEQWRSHEDTDRVAARLQSMFVDKPA